MNAECTSAKSENPRGPIVAIVAAVAHDVIVNASRKKSKGQRVIGANNALPWNLPGDLQHFKTLTMGKPIVMGRRTFESIGRPLPGRQNIVVTRNANFRPEGVEVASSLEEALKMARAQNPDEIFIIGGGDIYAQAMKAKCVDRMYITEVDFRVEDGDAFFPAFPQGEWEEKSRKAAMPLFNPAGQHPVFFVCYDRKE